MKKFIIFSSFFLFFIDQITKYIVVKNLEIYESIKIIPNFFNITYITNSGAAFGMFQNKGILFILLSICAIFLIIKYILEEKKLNKYDVICYSLLVGGILGNMFDRIYYKNVIDFIDFIIFGYNFYIFNFADVFILFGVSMMLYKLYKGDKNGKISSRTKQHKN